MHDGAPAARAYAPRAPEPHATLPSLPRVCAARQRLHMALPVIPAHPPARRGNSSTQ